MTRRRLKHSDHEHSAGIALVAVLWSVVLLTLIATMVLSIQRTQSHLARRFVDMALAEMAADSALNLTLLRIGTRDANQSGQHGSADVKFPEFIRNISVSILRERDRVDLNVADAGALSACFLTAGFSPDTARSMAARVIDWRDADDIAEPGGAEEADYRAAGLHYGPRNGPFQSVEELREVLGMDTLRSSVLSLFTVYTHEYEPDAGFDASFQGNDSPAVDSRPHCGGSRGGSGLSASFPSSQHEDLIGQVLRIRACSVERVHLCREVVARLTGSIQAPFQIFVWRTREEPTS